MLVKYLLALAFVAVVASVARADFRTGNLDVTNALTAKTLNVSGDTSFDNTPTVNGNPVLTNTTTVGWHIGSAGSTSYLRPTNGNSGAIQDEDGPYVMTWSPSSRKLCDVEGYFVASFENAFRVYDNNMANPIDVHASITNLIDATVKTNDARYLSAWQNPADATNWTWTSDGTQITLTGYTGPANVVIPYMLDALPVTGFGTIFQNSAAITSVSGGANIKTISDSAFDFCTSLESVSLPNAVTIGGSAFSHCALNSVSFPSATTIGDAAFNASASITSVSLPNATTIGSSAFNSCYNLASASLPNATTIGVYAFYDCYNLASVSLPNATTIGANAFDACTAMTSVNLPNATAIGNTAFGSCSSLTSVYFAQNAPAQATDVYLSTPNVTNYVTNPTATGWGATWNDRPVVRMTVYSDYFSGNGAGLTNITAEQVGAVATNDARYLASLTNISVNGNLGSVTNGIAYANVAIPDYDPVTSKIVVDNVSGQEVFRDYATASMASGVTDTWSAVSVSSNGLVVAAWTRDIVTGKGYVYIGTNGPNSLVKSTALGLQTSADVKVLADGSKIFATHYSSSDLKVTTNNGASWTTLLSGGGVGPSIDASDDGVVLVNGYYVSTNSGVSWFTTPGGYYGSGSSHAVSGDGNVIMVVDWNPPAGANRYYVSTNRGAFFTNTVNGSDATPYLGWGHGFSCATRTGDRIYIATWGNPVGQNEGNIAYLEAPNYNTLNRITPGGESRIAYQSVSCSPDGRGVIALAERTESREGSAYVSTNFGATWSDVTNLVDAGGGTTQPHWLGKCAWGHTFNGGYAVKGGSGEGKIYKVEVGSVVTNVVNLLGDVTVYGSVTASGGFSGSGSNLTGITAAQVGAVATNDPRYLTGWEDLSFPTESIYAFGLTDIEYNVPSNSIMFKTTCNTNFSTDHVWLVGQLPHSAKTNAASCNPHIHFVQNSSTQTNMFLIRYKTYKIGEQIPSTWTDIRLTNNAFAYTTGTIHQVAYGSNIPGPFGLSQHFDIKIWSRGSVACQLKFFDIHYQQDGFGSDLEYSKSF